MVNQTHAATMTQGHLKTTTLDSDSHGAEILCHYGHGVIPDLKTGHCLIECHVLKNVERSMNDRQV